MHRRISIFAMILFIGIMSGAAEGSSVFSSEALMKAEKFVAVVDSGDFFSAYDSGSKILKSLSDKDEWAAEQNRVFELLGRSLDRQLKTVRSRDSYPGMPDGNYLIVCYQTRTEYKTEAVEVLLLKESGEGWRVCKYSIR